MGGRKFRLSRHKNEERKRRLKKNKSMVVSIPRELVTITSFKLSFPISVYAEGTISSLESLSSRLASLPLPDSWIIANTRPLMLCKLRVQNDPSSARADVSMSVGVTDHLQWSLSLTNKQLDPGLCPVLSGVPSALTSATAVCSLLRLLNSTKICVGNPDTQFLDIWKQRSLTLHGSSGKSSHALHTITQLTLLNFVQDPRVHSLMTSPYNVAQLSGMWSASSCFVTRIKLFAARSVWLTDQHWQFKLQGHKSRVVMPLHPAMSITGIF